MNFVVGFDHAVNAELASTPIYGPRTPQTLVEISIYAMFNQNPFITLSLKVRVSFKSPREHHGICRDTYTGLEG